MSGHSKWANIKRQKGANDAKRSKVFSKMSRLISVAVREGGGDPASNPKLRLAIDKAKYAKMPKENIERAIAKGIGAGGGDSFEETLYEGYGPGGVAFYVIALTDNKNRTVSEVRALFSRNGGSLGGAGSTAYIFAANPDQPTFTVELQDPKDVSKIEQLVEALEDHDDVQDVYVNLGN